MNQARRIAEHVLIRVDRAAATLTCTIPGPNEAVRGRPRRHTWVAVGADSPGFECGIWECEPGAYRLEFDTHTQEFFCVLTGRLRVVPDAGKALDFGPGEACVIGPGFRGVVDVCEPVRKYYVCRQGSR